MSLEDTRAKGIKKLHYPMHNEVMSEEPLALIYANKGSRSGCTSQLGEHHYCKALYAWFQNQDLAEFRRQARLSAKLFAQAKYHGTYQDNELDERFIGRHLAFLMSNDPALLTYTMQRDSVAYETYQGEFYNIYIGNHHYQSVTLLLAMQGQFSLMKTRCDYFIDEVHKPDDERQKLQMFLPDYRFFLALAAGDIAAMEHQLAQLVTPEALQTRNTLEECFTYEEHLFAAEAFMYAKVAWMHGYQVQVDSPWLPMEWLDMTPLPDNGTEEEYSFVKEFDLFSELAGNFAQFTPFADISKSRDLTAVANPHRKPKPSPVDTVPVEQLPVEHMTQYKNMPGLVNQLYSQGAGFELVPNKRSVEYLSELLKQPDIQNINTETKVPLFGVFLGEAIIAHYGGQWVWAQNQEAVQVRPGLVTFPLGKIARISENNTTEDASEYFASLEALVKPETQTRRFPFNFWRRN